MKATKRKPKTHNLMALVDELGELKAHIAQLEVREKEIKAVLCDSGETMIRGTMYQAAIIDAERVTLDSTLVKSMLTPLQIISCQRVTTFMSVRVSARSE